MKQIALRNPNVRFIAGFLTATVSIPVLVIAIASLPSVQQSQKTYAAVYHKNPSQDSCGKVKVQVAESPVCPRLNGHGTNPNISNYAFMITLASIDGKSHAVSVITNSDFCTSGYVSGNPAQCDSNPINKSFSTNVSSRPSTLIIDRTPTVGKLCGSYQADFRIASVDGNKSCNYGTDSQNIGASGICETGITCNVPTPTPTQKPTPTSTPTPTNRPTPTPTQNPTPTLTPTLIPTNTPTPQPTNTPIPTNTPVPTTPPTSNTNSNTNNNNNSNTNNQNQNVTQNSNANISITNTNNPNISNTNTITIQKIQPTPIQAVLGAATSTQQSVVVAPIIQAKQLPSTGPESDILFGLLSLIPAGLGLRKISRNI